MKDSVLFIGDSRAIEQILKDKLILSNLSEIKGGIIRCANKNVSANLQIKDKIDFVSNNIKLKNVLYTQYITRNVVSLRKAVNAEFIVKLTDKGIHLLDEKQNKIIKEGLFDSRF